MSEEEREFIREIVLSMKSVIKFMSSGGVALAVYMFLTLEQVSPGRQIVLYVATIACLGGLIISSLIYRKFLLKLKVKMEK